jgi:hypothetical protein
VLRIDIEQGDLAGGCEGGGEVGCQCGLAGAAFLMRAVSMPVNASQFQVAAIRGQNKTG